MCTDSLLSPSFYEYGEAISAIPWDEYDETSMQLDQKETVPRYVSGQELIIEFAEGMTALAIYKDGVPTVYYVNRMIRLHPNVWFSVVPFNGESKVKLIFRKGAQVREQGEVPSEMILHQQAGLDFGKVCTFFCQEPEGNFYFSGESHEAYELVFLEQGCIHTIVDGEDVVLHPQECMIIGSNYWHMQYSDVKVRFMTISFTMNSPTIDEHINQSIKVTSDLALLFEFLAHKPQNLLLEEYVESLLKLLLVFILRSPVTKRDVAKYPATVHAENEILDRILQAIGNNITTPMSLKTLADDAHISVPYMYVLFDRHIGVPPGAYISKVRIEESKILLQDGQMTVSQISNKMGFSSPQRFSKQFKHIVGISPSEYIKRFRQSKQENYGK